MCPHDNYEASDVPEGWVQAPIGAVADLNPPKPPTDTLPPDAPVTFVPMPAVDAHSGTIRVSEDRPFGAVRKGYTSFCDNDVIFAKITPCMENGKAAIARGLTNGLGFGSTEFHVLRSTGAVIPEYLFYYLRQESFRQVAEANMTGSVGQKRVPVDFIRNAQLLVPPLNEQKRIVAKVDELLARVNAARERLAKVPGILKRFRQAVLAAVCSGRLTTNWREKNPDMEPASELFKRLRKEQFIKYELEERIKRPKVEGKRLLKHQEKPKMEILNTSGLLNLPKAWMRCGLKDFCEIVGGGTPSTKIQEYWDGDIPWITSADIVGLKDIRPHRYITRKGLENSVTKLIPRGNLVVVTRVGLGKIALNDFALCFSQDSQGVIVNKHFCLSEYLLYFLSKEIQRFKYESRGTTIEGVTKDQLKNILVAIPPPPEQYEIVRRVETLFRLADAIEKRIAAAAVRAERLTQAILAKAFRGELVPTEAELARREGRSYEPASVLLAKIEAQEKDAKPQ